MTEAGAAPPSAAPKQAGVVLVSFNLAAAVANLNLSVANVDHAADVAGRSR